MQIRRWRTVGRARSIQRSGGGYTFLAIVAKIQHWVQPAKTNSTSWNLPFLDPASVTPMGAANTSMQATL